MRALATGAWLPVGETVTVTVEGSLESEPSRTTSRKTRSVLDLTTGARKDGVAVSAPASVTHGPPTCVHWYVRVPPSGSMPLPSRLTVVWDTAESAGPALAVGARLTLRTFTVTSREA